MFDKVVSEWRKINNTFGVSHIVTFNSILKSIPSTFVDNLMDRCDLSGKLLPIKKLKCDQTQPNVHYRDYL